MSEIIQDGDLVFLGCPNNPTGASFAARDLLDRVVLHPSCCFAVDESFFEFIESRSELLSSSMPSNLIIFRSLTKCYAIPGLRLGFAVAAPQAPELLRRHILPWTVNTMAQGVGKAILGDGSFGEQSRVYIMERREELQQTDAGILSLKFFPGEANYLLIRLNKPGMRAAQLADRLLSSRPFSLALRVYDSFNGLEQQFFRVAVRGKRNTNFCIRPWPKNWDNATIDRKLKVQKKHQL